jgi:hypothetical protein
MVDVANQIRTESGSAGFPADMLIRIRKRVLSELSQQDRFGSAPISSDVLRAVGEFTEDGDAVSNLWKGLDPEVGAPIGVWLEIPFANVSPRSDKRRAVRSDVGAWYSDTDGWTNYVSS